MSCSSSNSSTAASVARAFCNQTAGDLSSTDSFITCATPQCAEGCQPVSSCSVGRKRIGTAVQGGVDTRLILRGNKFKFSEPDTVNYSYPRTGLLPLFQVVTVAGVTLQTGTPNVNYKGAWNTINYSTPKTAYYRVHATVQLDLQGKSTSATKEMVHMQIRCNGVNLANITLGEAAEEVSRLKSAVVHWIGQLTFGDIVDVFVQLDPATGVNQNVQASLANLSISEFGT